MDWSDAMMFTGVFRLSETNQLTVCDDRNCSAWSGVLKGTSGLYVRFFKKNVDGQGTQAIIKNLNLKKLKRFWNQNFIKVNDYTV